MARYRLLIAIGVVALVVGTAMTAISGVVIVTIGLVVMGIGGVLLVSLAFLIVGESEDRHREHHPGG